MYIHTHTHIHTYMYTYIHRLGITRQDDSKSMPRPKTQTSLPGIIRQTPQTQTPEQNDQSQDSKPESDIQATDNNIQAAPQTQTPNPIQRKGENTQDNTYKTAGDELDFAPGGRVNKSVRLQEIVPVATQTVSDGTAADLDAVDLPVVGEVRFEDMQVGSSTKWKVIAQNGLLVMSR